MRGGGKCRSQSPDGRLGFARQDSRRGRAAAGSAVAVQLAYACARLIASNGGRETRFAAAFLCFTAVTIAITAAVYALDYRQYYAHWHASAFSFTWLLQFVFTTLGALFQFSVTGVRLYFPVGFFALLAVSFWFARHRR
jgi:hypothetical protein